MFLVFIGSLFLFLFRFLGFFSKWWDDRLLSLLFFRWDQIDFFFHIQQLQQNKVEIYCGDFFCVVGFLPSGFFFITHYRYSESRNGNAFPLFSFAVARWRCWLFLAETMIYPDLRPEFPLFLLLLLLLLLLLFVPLLLLFCRHELKK